MKMNMSNQKGGVAALVLVLLMLAGPAFGYAGIVKVNKAGILSGVTDLRMIAGGADQSTAANLTAGVNYSIDNNSDATYRIYNLYDCPASSASLLMLKGSTYAILTPPLGTTVPITTTYDSVKFYKTGKPTPPIVANDGVAAGFETAKVVWTLDPDYQYNGVYFKLSQVANLSTPIGDALTGVGGGNYAFGEYVDGRKLTPGEKYYIGLWGTVAGVAAPSDYSTNASSAAEGVNVLVFSTKAGGGSISALLTLTAGLNFFALGIPSDAGGKWYGSTDNGVTYTPLASANDLLTKIGAARVSTFGYVDSTGAVVGVRKEGASFTGPLALTDPLDNKKGYQVYITAGNPVVLMLKNTL